MAKWFFRVSVWLLGSVVPLQAATLKPQVRWAQSNTTLYLELRPPKKLLDCGELSAEILFDRILVSSPCGDGLHSWDMELREDVWSEDSRSDKLPQKVGVLLLLRKRLQHRWDRPLMDEASFSLPRDWKREDTSLPDEDEIELPRARNIESFKSLDVQKRIDQMQTLVLAMRYPWCTACEEKDKAFVKLSKVAGGKETFANVTYGTLDLREEKEMARALWDYGLHNCTTKQKSCPLLVFKPDEPLNEPYQLHVQLLYEVDEAAMMADPMTGMPGHRPKGQTAKPDYERFERDLSLLLPPVILNFTDPPASTPLVVASGIPVAALRQAARQLRGTTSFALEQGTTPSLQLWRWELEKQVVNYDGDVTNLNPSYLEHFARIHSQPLLQNYSWTLKDQLDGIGMPIGVLWVNYSDSNNSNTTTRALTAFSNLCKKRRGTNSSRHILCCIMDQSNAYHQRDYGSHEPYPFPFFGVTQKLGFHAGDRYGYPFREPVNSSVFGFFSNGKSATRHMDAFVGKVLRGRTAPSHESNLVPNKTWSRGEVQEVVWKTFQKEINGSTADILLELYDDQRKKHHILTATMEVLAKTLKDYRDLKVARMEVSQNYVPPIFGRKQFSKETEYYWIPPSLANGEWTPTDPILYAGDVDEVTPGKLLRFLKKHTLSRWSLKEALELSDDISEEVMSYARQQQQADDRAEADKQQMIKKMMTTLKKEKGLVDVNEMMGLRKAAETLGETKTEVKKSVKSGKGGTQSKEREELSPEELEERRQKRREELKKEEEKQKEIARKDKEKRKQRKEAERLRKEKKKAEEEKRRVEAARVAEEKRKQKEAERLQLVATPLFSWGQSKEQIRVSVAIPGMQKESLKVNLTSDRVSVAAADWQTRRYSLDFELREFIVPENSSWSLRSSEESSRLEGVLMLLQKSMSHRWDRLAQNHSSVKNFLRKDWVQDDGEMEEEQEEMELPTGPNIKKVSTVGVQKLLGKHSLVVVAPRYPWCDKCKEKDREFAKAAKTSRDQDHLDLVAFAAMDAREEKFFARKHNASCDDACELLLFKDDEPEEPYTLPGRRFAEEIQVDCYKHLLPAVNIIKNKTHFNRVLTAFDTAIMGFFRGADKTSDPWFHRFRQVARELRGHALFGAVFQGTPADMGIDFTGEHSEVSGRPLVLLFKPKENRHVEFTGELTLEKLSHFSKVLSLPLLSQYTPESRQKYMELKVPLGMLWLDGDDADRAENLAAQEVARRLAIRFSGHLVFVSLNNTRDGFLLRPFGLDPRRVPCFGVSSSEAPEAHRFAFESEATSQGSFWLRPDAFERLEAFCSAFLNGTLEASHESAELPKSYRWPGPGQVEEVVWKTFRSAVAESENLLLELYSPYRPQHRTHLVVLDLVAEAVANITTLKVARMDTANNYVLPEFGLKDKEKSSSIFFRSSTSTWRRFAPKGGASLRAEEMPKQLLKFLHREMKSAAFDLAERLNWVNSEALTRIRRLKALEKDYEKKMQDEWMQKEMEEFERYKRMGKFDNLNL